MIKTLTYFLQGYKPILKIFEDTGYSRGRWKNHFHRTIDDAIEYAWSDLGCTNVSPPFVKVKFVHLIKML